MTLKEITLSNFQLKQLFEEFNRKLTEPGETAKYSWFMYQNCELLAKPYNEVLGKLFDERREPEFPEFYQKQQQLVMKYADRDEQNNIVHDQNGAPVINENIVEFNEANATLLKEYSTLYEKIQNKDKVNYEVYKETNVYKLYCLELSEFPPRTTPFIVGILGY